MIFIRNQAEENEDCRERFEEEHERVYGLVLVRGSTVAFCGRRVSGRAEGESESSAALSSPFTIQPSPAMAAFSKKMEEGLSFYYSNKTTVIQEARVFNESPISPRKCRALLTRIVYLLYIGENFGTQEATTLFFGTTKLFQHKDVRGRLRHFRIRLPMFTTLSPECLASDDLPVH